MLRISIITLFMSLAWSSLAQEKMNLPLYVVPQGNFLIDSDFTYESGGKDVLNGSGQRTTEHDTTSLLVSNDLRMGLGNSMDIGLNLTYWIKDELESTPINTSQSTTTINSSGFQELTLKARYRLPLEVMPGIVTNVDVNFSPSFSTAESANVTEDANKYYGGHRANIDFSAGTISHTFSWRATLGIDWNGGREEEPSTSSTVDEKTESSLDYGLELEAVVGASDTLYFGAQVGYTKVGAQDYYDPTTTTEATNESSSYSLIELAAKCDLYAADNLAINLGVGYQMLGERDDTTISTGNINATLDDQKYLDLSAGIQYLF